MEGSVSSVASVTSAMTTALSTAASDALSALATLVPHAMYIVTAVLVVTIGIKVFKRITGKA